MKDFIDKHNIKLVIVGAAVVVSSSVGKCSYDYSTGELEGSTNPAEVIEVIKAEEEDPSSPKDTDLKEDQGDQNE